MKKIPTVFERDWDGDASRVVNQVHPGCEWVLAGEGIATRKVDGVCCAYFGGVWLKRREIKPGGSAPDGFVLVAEDDETGKKVGWVPIGDGPEDKFMREAIADFSQKMQGAGAGHFEGTCEFLGPKSQGNVENAPGHMMLPHAWCEKFENVPRTFVGLREWLRGRDMEGLVFHHPDGGMAKIKLRDFGLGRARAAAALQQTATQIIPMGNDIGTIKQLLDSPYQPTIPQQFEESSDE